VRVCHPHAKHCGWCAVGGTLRAFASNQDLLNASQLIDLLLQDLHPLGPLLRRQRRSWSRAGDGIRVYNPPGNDLAYRLTLIVATRRWCSPGLSSTGRELGEI
jgi:hypothetical protein